MKISTRSRYGLRLMLELAMNYNKGALFLKDIARNENISEKYLSQIVITLKSRGLVTSLRGAKGGYMLARPPSKINLREAIEGLEGGFKLINCALQPSVCERNLLCPTRDIWVMLGETMASALESLSLKDLVDIYEDKKTNLSMYNI